jgi:hypothetical protein
VFRACYESIKVMRTIETTSHKAAAALMSYGFSLRSTTFDGRRMTFLIGVPSERRGEANYILETCTGVEMDIEVHLGRYEAAYRCFKNLLRKHIKRKYILETCTGVEMDIEVHLGRYEAAYRCFKNLLRKHIKRKYETGDDHEIRNDAEGRPAEPRRTGCGQSGGGP